MALLETSSSKRKSNVRYAIIVFWKPRTRHKGGFNFSPRRKIKLLKLAVDSFIFYKRCLELQTTNTHTHTQIKDGPSANRFFFSSPLKKIKCGLVCFCMWYACLRVLGFIDVENFWRKWNCFCLTEKVFFGGENIFLKLGPLWSEIHFFTTLIHYRNYLFSSYSVTVTIYLTK